MQTDGFGVTAWEFYGIPRWLFPGAVVVEKPTTREFKVERIEWARGDVVMSCGADAPRPFSFASAVGRFMPKFDEDGRQYVGVSRSEVMDGPWNAHLELGTRSYNACANAAKAAFGAKCGTVTLREFLSCVTWKRIRALRGVGKTTVEDIRRALDAHGLKLTEG